MYVCVLKKKGVAEMDDERYRQERNTACEHGWADDYSNRVRQWMDGAVSVISCFGMRKTDANGTITSYTESGRHIWMLKTRWL